MHIYTHISCSHTYTYFWQVHTGLFNACIHLFYISMGLITNLRGLTALILFENLSSPHIEVSFASVHWSFLPDPHCSLLAFVRLVGLYVWASFTYICRSVLTRASELPCSLNHVHIFFTHTHTSRFHSYTGFFNTFTHVPVYKRIQFPLRYACRSLFTLSYSVTFAIMIGVFTYIQVALRYIYRPLSQIYRSFFRVCVCALWRKYVCAILRTHALMYINVCALVDTWVGPQLHIHNMPHS